MIRNIGKAKVWKYVKEFSGLPSSANFEIVEEELAELKDGEFLASAEFLSVDPFQRAVMLNFKPPMQMIGGQIANIIESKNSDFPVGAKVFSLCGWRTHTILNPEKFGKHELYVLPDFGSLPYSYGLSVLGMPGNTARFGFLEICEPKEGEIVVVTAAAGAVGSIVGQIAKIKGCKVIGFAGSDEKCKWLEDELKFDKAINYKNPNVEKLLKEAAPNGIDCFFDNVGGKLGHMINEQMRLFGRISICGAISTYNDEDVLIPAFKTFHRRNLKMEGFNVHVRWSSRFMEGIKGNLEWVRDGKIKFHETITEGFENMPKAFIDLFSGGNTGKAIIKV